jgi:hypothetical protein
MRGGSFHTELLKSFLDFTYRTKGMDIHIANMDLFAKTRDLINARVD